MIRGVVHYYLYARCKTPECKGKLFLAHQEMPEGVAFIDYPDEWFPVSVKCAVCGRTDSYSTKEIQTETSQVPHHFVGWKPVLPDPPKPRDTN